MNYFSFPGTATKQYIPAQMTYRVREQWAQQIIHTVSIFYNVEICLIKGKKRSCDLIRSVQVSTYLIKLKIKSMSLREIAAQFDKRYYGNKGYDHSAIIHNLNKVNDLLSIGDSISADIDKLIKLI